METERKKTDTDYAKISNDLNSVLFYFMISLAIAVLGCLALSGYYNYRLTRQTQELEQ